MVGQTPSKTILFPRRIHRPLWPPPMTAADEGGGTTVLVNRPGAYCRAAATAAAFATAFGSAVGEAEAAFFTPSPPKPTKPFARSHSLSSRLHPSSSTTT